MHIRKSNHRVQGPPTDNTFQRLSMCLWRAVMSMLKTLAALFFIRPMWRWESVAKVRIWMQNSKKTNLATRIFCSRAFYPHVHPHLFILHCTQLTIWLLRCIFFFINGRQNKGFCDHFTWAILWMKCTVQKGQKHIATHNYVIDWMYMGVVAWMLVEVRLRSWGTEVFQMSIERGRGEYSRKDASCWVSRPVVGLLSQNRAVQKRASRGGFTGVKQWALGCCSEL